MKVSVVLVTLLEVPNPKNITARHKTSFALVTEKFLNLDVLAETHREVLLQSKHLPRLCVKLQDSPPLKKDGKGKKKRWKTKHDS